MGEMEKAPISERVATTIAEAYEDAHTALVMAAGNINSLENYLRTRLPILRARIAVLKEELQEIEILLNNYNKQTNSWREEIKLRRDEAKRQGK